MDWTTIITASITALVAIAMPVVLAWSKIKFIAKNTADTLVETTAQTATLDRQAERLDETHNLVNGASQRMERLYQALAAQEKLLSDTQKRLAEIEAFARGKASGKEEAE